eukprot:TRINITY_DN61549_c0_g1_i1.p1 TRINITY_DN61549_c0_g1~~TRINITY_DN61549_c0_g1_i1.p1  ORF type:complete len:504 (+),score=95.42 TRINITY_DN61549_c0_g1_i1:56-1567(+)
MGRKKIEIKPIRDERNCSVTFSKRKQGLIKKAMELSILCDCQISLVVFFQQQLFEYCSSDPRQILQKYMANAHIPHERLTNNDYKDKFLNTKGPTGTEVGEEDDDLTTEPSYPSSNFANSASIGSSTFTSSSSALGADYSLWGKLGAPPTQQGGTQQYARQNVVAQQAQAAAQLYPQQQYSNVQNGPPQPQPETPTASYLNIPPQPKPTQAQQPTQQPAAAQQPPAGAGFPQAAVVQASTNAQQVQGQVQPNLQGYNLGGSLGGGALGAQMIMQQQTQQPTGLPGHPPSRAHQALGTSLAVQQKQALIQQQIADIEKKKAEVIANIQQAQVQQAQRAAIGIAGLPAAPVPSNSNPLPAVGIPNPNPATMPSAPPTKQPAPEGGEPAAKKQKLPDNPLQSATTQVPQLPNGTAQPTNPGAPSVPPGGAASLPGGGPGRVVVPGPLPTLPVPGTTTTDTKPVAVSDTEKETDAIAQLMAEQSKMSPTPVSATNLAPDPGPKTEGQ